MIRTTISKLRKVCTTAFVPRALRGNLRYTPSICVALGKFEKFTSAVKCVQKSTKATGDDDLPQSSEKHLKNRISDVSLSKPLGLTNNDLDIRNNGHNVMGPDIPSNISSRSSPPLYNLTSATQYSKCKVTDEIFDEPTPQDDLLALSKVNMSDDINDGKIKKTYKKPCKTTPYVKIKQTTDDNHSKKTEDNFQSVLRYDAVLTKEKGAKVVKEAKIKPVEVKENVQQLNTSLYDVDPDEYISKWKIDTKALKLSCNGNFDKQEVDSYWSGIYGTAIENKAAYYESNQAIDLETMNVYRSLKQGDTNSKDTLSETKRINHTPQELNRIIHGSPFDDLADVTVKTTTNKQNEETLAQKLEHIDETPLVVAEQPKVEGFNTTPKILGNLDKPTPIANNNLHSAAQRCQKLSQSDVDKILLKEMEQNLGIPITGQKASFETKTDNSLQSETLYTSGTCELKKPQDDFSVGKFSISNIIPNNLAGLSGVKLNPSILQAEEQYWHCLNRRKSSKESSEVTPSNLCAEKSKNILPSTDHVEPFDPKDNTNDTAISNDHIRTDTSALNQSDELEISQASKPTANKHNPNLSEDIWTNDHLDPNHILTCNETCSISPRLLVNDNELNSIKGAEAVLESSVLPKCLEMEKEKENVKAQPVTEKAGESFSPREINYECYNAKANEANSLDDYIKILQAGNLKMMDEGRRIKEDPTMELTKRSTTEVFSATPLRLPESEFGSQMPLVVPVNYIKQIGTNGTMTSTIKPLGNISTEVTKQSINPPKFYIGTEPYMAYEHSRNYASYKTENPVAHLVNSILATSEELQAASQKLQATSLKLEAASEQLHATKEQLHATKEKLQAASEKLEVASEQLQATSEKLEISCEKLDCRDAMRTNATEVPVKEMKVPSSVSSPLADVAINSSVDASVDPVIKSTIEPLTESPTTPNAQKTAATTAKADSPKANQLADKGAASTSTLPVADETLFPLKPLPKIKDNIKLSELMKMVKERNQLRSHQYLLTYTNQAKKSIPPMQQPRHRTPVFKPPGYPKLKPRPRTCSPRSKPKKTNCSQCDLETLGLDYNLGPQFNRNEPQNNGIIYQQTSQGVALTNDAFPSADLSEEIILQLQSMGYILESAYKRGKIGLEAAALAKTRYQFRSKDYTPWTPIPSWPFPKKYKRPKLQHPKEGCPPPPPAVYDSPIGLKPCTGFPTYPKRTFSLLDFCTIRLGDPKIIDIGEF